MSNQYFKRIRAFLEKNEYYIFLVIMTIVIVVFVIAFFVIEPGSGYTGP
jgi:capsular polysaccharide biosynthesis protein